jgi:hypothetical protein
MVAAGIAMTVLVTACELGTVDVPRTTPTVVVHGVLNPSSSTQVVLLERTLTGTKNIPDTSFDSTDPIVSAGGIPITGATVQLVDSTGRLFQATEDLKTLANGKGAGVYRFALPGTSLVLGSRYELRVRTTQGENVTAFTRIPQASGRAFGALSRTVNRDHDTLFIQWIRATAARSYMVRVESPFGPFFLFTDSTAVRLTPDLRNIFSNDFERVFIPGFRQDIVVGAVDSNFYDYYRTNNDPFTGAGIISRVEGGTGFFGSLVSLNNGTLTVIADQTEPNEGRFRFLTNLSTNTFASQFVLYVESKPARDGLPIALTGRYTTSLPNSRSDGIVGQQLGTTITLALISNQLAVDTAEVFIGELKGDTLSGSYRKSGGSATFVRSP